MRLAVIALALGALLAAPVPALATPATQEYLVQAEDGASAEVAVLLDDLGAAPDALDLVDGFAVDLTASQAAALAVAPDVLRVSEPVPLTLADVQDPAPSWGLDRIDQQWLPLNGRFAYDPTAGTDVLVYVVDTGVNPDPSLAGRLAPGYSAIDDGLGTVDCHGHGTHVAGTVASTTWGVAKQATVVPVKVFSCAGTGTSLELIDALDWIAGHHPSGAPGVVSMSLTGSIHEATDDAVAALTDLGLTVVAAAGNESTDACTRSPAGAPQAVTVGASDASDTVPAFSNTGSCVDLLAPGVAIRSLGLEPATSSLMSGTSMATPHVTGIAALYLADHPTDSPAQVTAALLDAAAPAVVGPGDTTTLLAQVVPAGDSEPGPVVDLATSATRTTITATWSAPLTWPEAVTGYRVEARTDGLWQQVATTTDRQLSWAVTSGQTYRVRVATLAGGVAAWSAEQKVIAPPSAPRSLVRTAKTAQTVSLDWVKPAAGVTPTGYAVQKSTDGGATWRTVARTTTSTKATVTGLRSNTSYAFRVIPKSVLGNGTASAVVTTRTYRLLDRDSPFGRITSTRSEGRSLTVSGWALDPDTVRSIRVTVRIDGKGTTLTAARPRSVVLKAYPAYGSRHGFLLERRVTRGWHTVTVTAHDVGPGSSRVVDTERVWVP